jgi:hypothetical protein
VLREHRGDVTRKPCVRCGSRRSCIFRRALAGPGILGRGLARVDGCVGLAALATSTGIDRPRRRFVALVVSLEILPLFVRPRAGRALFTGQQHRKEDG